MADGENTTPTTTTQDDLVQTVTEAIAKPQSYSVDGETITQRSMTDIESAIRLLNKMRIRPKDCFKCLGIVKASTPGTNER